MKIGIIGAGNIGGSLGKVWGVKGHEIVYGVRDAGSPKTQKALASGAKAVSIAEAAAFGEMIVLAVPGDALKETVAALGDVSGKIIVDTTNRFSAEPNAAPSAAEDIARFAPGARVVKAFNTMGWETLIDPIFSGQAVTAFVCGDDSDAKKVVMNLAQDIGLGAVDAGPLSNAAAVESIARLWVFMMRNGLGRDFAFTMLKR